MVNKEDINLDYFLEHFNLKRTSIVDGKVMIDDNFFVLTAAFILMTEELRSLQNKLEHLRTDLI